MDHFVVLEQLPAGLQFPAEYGDRITYDPEARRLYHRGFMCKGDFDRLWLLSEDWSYRRSLENLFRLCTDEGPARPRGFRRWISPLFSFGAKPSAGERGSTG
jgi:hypothetical protein